MASRCLQHFSEEPASVTSRETHIYGGNARRAPLQCHRPPSEQRARQPGPMPGPRRLRDAPLL